MGTYIDKNSNSNQQPVQKTSNVSSVSVSKQHTAEVKSKVTIPMYFYSIIVPQLGSYYDLYPVNFENKVVVCCPLHDEDTPSCRYYEETNSFYCFGCQRGGDVIALHRFFVEKLNGVRPPYNESVIFLYNYFIVGRNTDYGTDQATQSIIKPIPKEKLNSDFDIVKFNLYRVNLEKAITYDEHLKYEIKLQLWELLDTIDCLIDKNLIKVSEAEKELRDRVKQLINVDSYNKKIEYNRRKEDG